jgi:hypothetical protein
MIGKSAAIAEILCSVLFESCSIDNPNDRARIEKIVPIIKSKGLDYIPNSYIKAYSLDRQTNAGENFQKMLRLGSDVFDD